MVYQMYGIDNPNTPSGSFVNYYGEPLDKDAVERILEDGQYVEETHLFTLI